MRVGESQAAGAAACDVDGIVADIYHAASGTKPWAAVLGRISDELGLRGAQMIGVSPATGAVLFSHTSGQFASELELEYIRTYHRHDPRVPLLMAKSEGEWLFDQDEIDDAVANDNPYYRDLLIPCGGRYSASAKLLVKDDEMVLLAFLSRLGDADFTPARRAVLQTLAFHLREAAAIHHETRKLKGSAFVGMEVVRRMDRPALLLGVDRSVSFVNPAAEHYMGDGRLFLAGNRLAALDARTDSALTAAFAELQHDMGLGGVPRRRIVRLFGRHKAEAAALSLTAFVPQESLHAFGVQPQVLVVVHERQMAAEPDTLLWEAAFDFTPAQSRVALCIFQGLGVKEAAAMLQVGQPTVKSHLQQVFEKTGTSRQAQLISCLSVMQTH